MAEQRGPAPEQRWIVSRWLVLLAVVWSVVAALSWLDDDSSTFTRWAWTGLAVIAVGGAVVGVRRIRQERHRPR